MTCNRSANALMMTEPTPQNSQGKTSACQSRMAGHTIRPFVCRKEGRDAYKTSCSTTSSIVELSSIRVWSWKRRHGMLGGASVFQCIEAWPIQESQCTDAVLVTHNLPSGYVIDSAFLTELPNLVEHVLPVLARKGDIRVAKDPYPAHVPPRGNVTRYSHQHARRRCVILQAATLTGKMRSASL